MREPSPLSNPLGKRGSACVEVMTTLHGSTPSPWRRVEGWVLPKSTIASARDPLTHPFHLIEPPWPCRLSPRYFNQISFPNTWVHLLAFRAGSIVIGLVTFIVALVTIGFGYPLHSLILVWSYTSINLSIHGLYAWLPFSQFLQSYPCIVSHQCFRVYRSIFVAQSRLAFLDQS